ncbi:hypothetical protein NSED_05825 [Candidatus Nitrosopumilus sediminis]|uniref:Uncharacterized protein n=2 Tax=Candidatus Nitrosopumilus sediminis TaxID=1229909 RepID=K0BD37_9ARCH|nr:hypothetical protein NSED_05825 [Candidatus Nitrosopumilus sediminis]
MILAGIGFLLIFSVPESFAEDSFNGYSSVDPPISEVVAGQSSVMNIRFWYTSGPYAMENFAPVLEVSPFSARQFVKVDVDSIGITQGQIKRIPITLNVDPHIEHDKIFLSISYVGHHFQTDELQKSSWNDQVVLNIKDRLVPEPEQDKGRVINENCEPGTTFQDGICVVSEQTVKTNSTGIWGHVVEIPSTSPLKQLQSGIPVDEIQCKDGLVQIFKKSDNSPACVTPETKEKLIERGWAILTPKEILYDIEKILDEKDCVGFGRWLDEHATGNFNENLLIFDLPIPYELSQTIRDSILYCVENDSGGFFYLNTKHFIDFDKLEKDSSKPYPIEEKYRERYNLEIVGLKDEYMLGEEYSFYFVISGYGHECAGINLSYPDEDGKLQGWAQMPLCDPNVPMHEFKTNYYDRGELFGNITIKNPGTYTITVIFEQPNKYFPTTTSTNFYVVEN